MKEYIDKAALVAEIEKRKSELQLRIAELGTFESNALGLFQDVDLYNDILTFLDTLDVKETPESNDLEEEIDNELKRTWYGEYLDTDKFKESAVYFYELGLKAKGE